MTALFIYFFFGGGEGGNSHEGPEEMPPASYLGNNGTRGES